MSNQNPGSENLQNGSLNQNKTSWMNDSRLSGIDPAKLQMLFSMSGQGASKSQNELMPFLMAVATRSRQNGMTFTPEETNLIIEVMKQGKSKEEIAQLTKDYLPDLSPETTTKDLSDNYLHGNCADRRHAGNGI